MVAGETVAFDPARLTEGFLVALVASDGCGGAVWAEFDGFAGSLALSVALCSFGWGLGHIDGF